MSLTRSTVTIVRRGFTLVELMMVIVMLGILAAIVLPLMANADDSARSEAMATIVQQVRRLVQYHAGRGEVALSTQGFPMAIGTDWFPADNLPDHLWSDGAMIVEVVSIADENLPATKVFDPTVNGANSAWYNTATGAFCVRIPSQVDDAQTLALFNDVNVTTATSLNQVK